MEFHTCRAPVLTRGHLAGAQKRRGICPLQSKGRLRATAAPCNPFCLPVLQYKHPAASGPSSSGQSSGSNTLGYGHGPVLTWQPSASTSPGTLWLSSEEGYMWVSCIIQWLGALRAVRAWRLYATATHAVPQIADQQAEEVS